MQGGQRREPQVWHRSSARGAHGTCSLQAAHGARVHVAGAWTCGARVPSNSTRSVAAGIPRDWARGVGVLLTLTAGVRGLRPEARGWAEMHRVATRCCEMHRAEPSWDARLSPLGWDGLERRTWARGGSAVSPALPAQTRRFAQRCLPSSCEQTDSKPRLWNSATLASLGRFPQPLSPTLKKTLPALRLGKAAPSLIHVAVFVFYEIRTKIKAQMLVWGFNDRSLRLAETLPTGEFTGW